jgi:transposase InsO family protein
MCEVLQVSSSGYYEWRKRPPSQRKQANERLLAAIRAEYEASRRTYGSPRIHAALRRKGVKVGQNRVARLMRLYRIKAKNSRKRKPRTTQPDKQAIPAPNLLKQNFTANRPNEIWLADITYIPTRQGTAYLAAVLDLYARPIVGWAMADHMQASLVAQALRMALGRRFPQSDLIHHSDRGSQYTSDLIQTLLKEHHIQVSMSGTGNCYDNSPMESFFGTLKTECADTPFPTHADARRVIFEYIEVWYNRQRLHSSIGYLPPLEAEQLFLPLS